MQQTKFLHFHFSTTQLKTGSAGNREKTFKSTQYKYLLIDWLYCSNNVTLATKFMQMRCSLFFFFILKCEMWFAVKHSNYLLKDPLTAKISNKNMDIFGRLALPVDNLV